MYRMLGMQSGAVLDQTLVLGRFGNLWKPGNPREAGAYI